MRFLPLVIGASVLLLSVVVAIGSGVPGVLTDRLDTPWLTAAAMVLAVLSGAAAAAATRYTWPIVAMAALGWILVGLWPAIIVASFCAGMRAKRLWLGLYLLLAFTLMAIPILPTMGTVVGLYAVSAVVGFIVLVPALLGWLTNARNEVMADLRVRALTAERNQLLREEQARADERVAIAREMHDIVAHRIALITMHTGAMSLAGSDPHLTHHASLIRGLGRQALTELRQLLGVLRAPGSAPASPAGDADVGQLVQETREAGLSVQLTRTGLVRPLPAAAELTSYRIIQESLTNVATHAGTPHTTVTVDYGKTELKITVANEPPAGHSFDLPSGGLGLIGLGERVALLHGTLKTTPHPQAGFTLEATLPIPEPTG